jgi:hypothetical protein
MKEFLPRAATLVAAVVCGTIVGMLAFPFGLVMAWFAILPLTFGIAALFAAIAAAWSATLLAPNRTGSRLLPVVGLSEATAAIVAVVALIPFLVPGVVDSILGNSALGWVSPSIFLATSMVVIGLVASWAAWRFRTSGRRLGRDAWVTFGLIGLALLIFAGTFYAGILFGFVGT